MIRPVATGYYHHPYAQQAAHGQYYDPAFTSVGYRPLQLPLQYHQQAAAEQQQLSLAAAGFHAPNFRPHQQQLHQQILPVRTRHQSQRNAMAAQGHSEEDYAELQKLSNEYEPEVTGPLVGPREPSTNIATEYASADPVYQAKTAALAQTYSHYRTTRGDGKCGWRAIAFGYYEALIHWGDSNRFLEEEGRLRSLTNIIAAAGFDNGIIDEFADEAFDLLRRVASGLQAGNAHDVLYEGFNDDSTQNYVITYLKTLTAAWMKTHQADYAPWLLGRTVDQFCDDSVLPMGSEIENVSLTGLKDVLLSPAGIALEVLYLDRSEGGEVNMHRFSPISHHGEKAIATIRLLYRPGHYDILYDAGDFPPPPPPPPPPPDATPLQTYLQFGSQQNNDHVFGIDYAGLDFMTTIPGMSCINPQQAWSSYGGGMSDFFATPAPVQQCVQPTSVPAPAPTPAPQPHIQPQPVYTVPATPTHLVAPPNELTQELAIRSASHSSATNASLQPQLAGPFRPSFWQFEEGFLQATSQTPFQTTQFKNSHFNTAHFNNPDFHPEEWRPDNEYVTTSSKPLRHKNSG